MLEMPVHIVPGICLSWQMLKSCRQRQSTSTSFIRREAKIKTQQFFKSSVDKKRAIKGTSRNSSVKKSKAERWLKSSCLKNNWNAVKNILASVRREPLAQSGTGLWKLWISMPCVAPLGTGRFYNASPPVVWSINSALRRGSFYCGNYSKELEEETATAMCTCLQIPSSDFSQRHTNNSFRLRSEKQYHSYPERIKHWPVHHLSCRMSLNRSNSPQIVSTRSRRSRMRDTFKKGLIDVDFYPQWFILCSHYYRPRIIYSDNDEYVSYRDVLQELALGRSSFLCKVFYI